MKVYKQINPPDRKEKITLRILILFGIFSLLNFFYWFLIPGFKGNALLYYLLLGVLIFDSLRILYIWYHYWDISIPQKPGVSKKYTVDVFTTYFPGEPRQMVKTTLLAIQKIKYPHTTYLCDEANDPVLKEFCSELGIVHVTRSNRINAKAGNINNALKQAQGEICLILDPDHIPCENFLESVIPYFEDESIGFVQSVQAYYNIEESNVARGAAEQTFQFYGPMMMTMNSYGTVNAIGANCLFRREALDSIGGHAPGLSEDMHTAMQLYAKGWKSVYVPEIFTKGLVPSSLTSYYKQQLKWSRGTLELLVSVYPKLFRQFTLRQKIHFGILPLYYLTGVFYLISFLIPIISLLSATTPWRGNILNFGLIYLPLFICLLGIRFYVQRWVADKSERGSHIMGGILSACTWWIFIIGFAYTVIRKKVPYLPTPKEDTSLTNWKILVPNLFVGFVSLFSIGYGLKFDFTPFSILMSGFALANAGFMFYTLVFAFQKQKPIKFDSEPANLHNANLNQIRNYAFETWHKLALPVIIGAIIILGGTFYKIENSKWGSVKPEIPKKNIVNYIGIYAPQANDGLSSVKNIIALSKEIDESFDVISFYIPWTENPVSNFPSDLLDSIYQLKSIPMITWEPWTNWIDSVSSENKHVFELVYEGYFDNYIEAFAENLKKLNRPIFLRFAHEFDNPFYPWFKSGDNAAIHFKKAWIHTYEIFKRIEANYVIWIWNPWKSENMAAYYPGKDYVDWIGVNILNYGELNNDNQWHDFKSLYEPFHNELRNLPQTPVIISEFGSLRKAENQTEWISDALHSIEDDFEEIKSVVFFNNNHDDNFPEGTQLNEYLEWTVSDNRLIKKSFSFKNAPEYVFKSFTEIKSNKFAGLPMILENTKTIRGINIKKGFDWRKDYYVLNRENIENDFEKIRNLGINTVKFDGNSIYNYNLLKISKEFNLHVSYGFWIPANTDFVEDSVGTENLKQDIINSVRRLKHHTHIKSWNIQNDVQFNQKDFYLKPRLFYQNLGYVLWLQKLIEEIKKTDSSRPVIVDIEINKLSEFHSKMLIENLGGIDALGLVVKEDVHLESFLAFLNKSKAEFVYSEIMVDDLLNQASEGGFDPFFISAWRDIHESNKLTFDGILDWKGRFRTDYFQLQNALKNLNDSISMPIVKILKPAVLIYENDILNFHALWYDDSMGWRFTAEGVDFNYTWSLVKCDNFGNALAIKEIGTGPALRLKIPANYENFKLLLTASNGKKVTSDLTRLNTP